VSGRAIARDIGRRRWSWVAEGIVASGRGLVLCGLMLAGVAILADLALAVFVLGSGGSTIVGHSSGGVMVSPVHVPSLVPGRLPAPTGPVRVVRSADVKSLPFLIILLIPLSVLGVRWLARLTRSLTRRWCGVQVAAPYRPPLRGESASWWQRFGRQARRVLGDPATWRDLLWMIVNACGGWLLAALPAALIAAGVATVILPVRGVIVAHTHGAVLLVILLGLASVALGLRVGPPLLTAYGTLARTMLGPTRRAELALRVRHLAETRTDTIDTGAAEMRRIERDLHDGAQARLVAMGMTLDAADQLIDTSPAAARALLAEARDSSVKALAELRDLVRGIHPPVLADRGLAEAVRAVALDMPIRAQVACELPGRPPPPVESAAYFAVSELLTNVSKHAGAGRTWIDIRHSDGMLRIAVTDDGYGGADPGRGTGLRGIERRLAAFDGVLAVSSPLGGPTVVNMEIPCALSSPKMSSS
jgi:signal transduction histidine kinase